MAGRSLSYVGSGEGESGAVTATFPAPKGTHKVEVVVAEAGGGSFLYGGEITAIYTATGVTSGLAYEPLVRPVHPRNNG
ncbi:hypothetical protein ASE01_04525 [Nocardioides sp. Root190]|uniref:hypothetical protein n=1 Tax=Nocardioides sp. Root190 TaxID=1736488 RepID=UPI0006FE275C|nr:hypothetical protein [Nocardioides sp. Root190]KRB78531.1 hypothetical protein ASE01_04525 [Nocardioides sp. Root190]